MLKAFLYIYEAIKTIINSSKSKVFKNKSLFLTNIEITFLNNILNIISIVGTTGRYFTKALIYLLKVLISVCLGRKREVREERNI
jgi:hypothetical protein